MDKIRLYIYNCLCGVILCFYLPIKYIVYNVKNDNNVAWKKIKLGGMVPGNNLFFNSNDKLDVAKRVTVMMLLVTTNAIMSFVSMQLYIGSYLCVVLYILWINGKNKKYGTFDFLVMLAWICVLVLLLSIYFGNIKSCLALMFLGVVLLLPMWRLNEHKALDDGTYKYALLWLYTGIFVAFITMFSFGMIDYPYLNDLNIEVADIKSNTGNMTAQSIVLYFTMLGYVANLTYYQMPINDKIDLLVSNAGWMMPLQIIVIVSMVVLMFLAVPRFVRGLYKDFFA